MDDKLYTVNDVLVDRPCPSITPVVVSINNEYLPVIIIKEFRDNLKIIKEDQLVAIKSSSMGNSKVVLFLIILKFGENFDSTYDVWFNYGLSPHRDFLNLLKDKDRIIIDFRNELNERYLTLELKNTIKEHLEFYSQKCEEGILVKDSKDNNIINLSKIEKYKTWDEEDSFILMDKLFEDYPNIEDLWDNL